MFEYNDDDFFRLLNDVHEHGKHVRVGTDISFTNVWRWYHNLLILKTPEGDFVTDSVFTAKQRPAYGIWADPPQFDDNTEPEYIKQWLSRDNYYYELRDPHSAELVYESDTQFNTIDDIVGEVKKILISKEAVCRVFTSPPGRPYNEIPVMSFTIDTRYYPDQVEIDYKLMLRIYTKLQELVSAEGRPLTLDEVRQAILEISDWSLDTEDGQVNLAIAIDWIEERANHLVKFDEE